MPARYVVRPVEPRDVDGLVALFTRDGSPCFCRYWHHAGTNKEWEARCAFDPEANADELRVAVTARREDGLGLVAEHDGAIVGWMKLAPRATLSKLHARAPYKGLDAPIDTLAIGCFLVDLEHRKHGVAGLLVDGAIAHARALGASTLEAYPRLSHDGGATMHDGELFMGPARVFTTRGFTTVREGTQYPTLRRALP